MRLTTSSKSNMILYIFQLETSVTPVISTIFPSVSDDATTDSACDLQNKKESEFTASNLPKALNLNRVVNMKNADTCISNSEYDQSLGIWPQICNIENTPALKLSWKTAGISQTVHKLLNVDPNHVSCLQLCIP